jgi:predicted ATPase
MNPTGSAAASVSEPATQLVGRASELALLSVLLARDGVRLVTLTGPGGIGKTRLALGVAATVQGTCGDGSPFVDLSAVSDQTAVLTALANALGIPNTGLEPLLETLQIALRDRHQRVILDNFERVLDAAPAIAELLETCPRLSMLVTSRARLHLEGEYELSVPPLPVPDVKCSAEASGVAAFGAVQLFVERARAARADFRLTDANAAAVAEICVRLDGIPLALELAAARIKVLSAEQIAERLQDRFRLLTTGAEAAPPRHRTLRATLDLSFDLLSAPERALLRRLGVFAGAGIEAMETVCSGGILDADHILDSLSQLVDQSLVSVREQDGVARYRLLDTVRQYAIERLREADEESALPSRHAGWCLDFVERTDADLRGRDQLACLAKLERDHDNVRAALTWSLATRSADAALRLAGGLWKFWEVHGHAGEGERWLAAALDLDADGSADPRARAKALHGAANLAFIRADYDRTAKLHEANLALYRQLDDTQGIGISLFHLASVWRNRGEQNAP